ncbi:MAG TPA: hypothetical protein VG184_06605 [Acidimicrobiales bacterium]|jgi:hypothetical protein|nr:hypothetical protein [Acidimicrobiales bacterium]
MLDLPLPADLRRPGRDPFLSDEPRRRPPPSWLQRLAVVGVVVALAAGIAGAATVKKKTGHPATLSTEPASQRLAGRMLASGDLAGGWTLYGSVNNAPAGHDAFGGASPLLPGCLGGAPDRGRMAEAEVELIDGPSAVPALDEAVAELPGDQASSAFAAVASEMSACDRAATPSPTATTAATTTTTARTARGTTKTATTNTTSTTATTLPATRIVRLSLPAVGDQSAAWQVTQPSAGHAASAVLLVVRRANDLVLVIYGSFGDPQPGVVLPFARTAVAKLG